MAGEDEVRKQALARLNAKRGLRTSAISFAGVSLILVVIWAATGADGFWPAFPIGAFVLALAVQAWHVYGDRPITEADIQREMQRGGG